MPTSANRTRLESIDWQSVFPAVKLAAAFRMAIQPGKLIVALVAVLILHFAGLGLDAIWGDAAASPFTNEPESAGVYEALADRSAMGFAQTMDAALSLDLGLTADNGRPGLLGALARLAIDTPAWLVKGHPWFAAVYGLIALFTLTLLGGMVCRMAATQACTDQSTSLTTASRYVMGRWFWFVLTPLMPLILIGLLGLLLILAGLVLFNIPVVDLLGAVLYGPLLLIGLFIAVIAFVLFFGIHLMTPALAVEGTDGFDAVSRAMNYVLYRPWQLAGFLVAAVIYAAVVYLIVAAVMGLGLSATAGFVETGVVAGHEGSDEVSRFEAILAAAEAQRMGQEDWVAIEGTDRVSAWIIARWIDLAGALVAAVMLSLYFTLQTWVYLLIRRSADGTPLDDCDAGESTPLWSSPIAGDTPAQGDTSADPEPNAS